MLNERWLPLNGFSEGLFISDHGRVRRGDRILKQATDRYGYNRISLRSDGKVKFPTIHRLVATHFIGSPSGRLECAHLDGDQTNNFWRNLSFVTTAENSRHRIIHGTQVNGETHGCSKLTENDVVEIRETLKRGCSMFGAKALSVKFGVDPATIRRAYNGTNWFRAARNAMGGNNDKT